MHNAPLCHQCKTLLVLLRMEVSCYAWKCPNGCLSPIDTGVPVSQVLYEIEGAEFGNVEFNASLFRPPLPPEHVTTAKVFMIHVLDHFIDCTRGACYNSLYFDVLVPHLDSVDVVDYVLKSPVIRTRPDVVEGKTGARIYGELRQRLNGVQSEKIRKYISENFSV
jgi:hypothetical protein